MVNISAEMYNDVCVIMISGELYLESIDYLENIWNENLQKKPKVMGIDCSKVAFIDSSGIGAFVKFYTSATENNIELIFFDLSKTFFYLFKTARLNNFFKTMTRSEFERAYL